MRPPASRRQISPASPAGPAGAPAADLKAFSDRMRAAPARASDAGAGPDAGVVPSPHHPASARTTAGTSQGKGILSRKRARRIMMRRNHVILRRSPAESTPDTGESCSVAKTIRPRKPPRPKADGRIPPGTGETRTAALRGGFSDRRGYPFQAGDATDDFEWIEVRNIGTRTANLFETWSPLKLPTALNSFASPTTPGSPCPIPSSPPPPPPRPTRPPPRPPPPISIAASASPSRHDLESMSRCIVPNYWKSAARPASIRS